METLYVRTIGESRMQLDFSDVKENPTLLEQINIEIAKLINLCDKLKEKDGRWASMAQSDLESAANWAFKAYNKIS